MANINPRDLRDAFGSFATGVTVVTALCKVDSIVEVPVAMTANSFCSVSLDPPLVLWSLDSIAKCFSAFSQFMLSALPILHRIQEEISSICSTRNAHIYAFDILISGHHAVTILYDYHHCFQLSAHLQNVGGDHQIIVGRVLEFDNNERESHTNPLLFYRGKYTKVA